MASKLVRARKHHLCSACGQLIVPGELYRAQHWAPWELEDGDGHYWSQPACRWCADRVWSALGSDPWSADFVDEWVWEEMWRWLQLAGVEMDWTIPAEYKQPLRAAQKAAHATMERTRNRESLIAFYRAIGVDPWAEWTPECRWNRVQGPSPAGYLYRCGFRQPPIIGSSFQRWSDHMVAGWLYPYVEESSLDIPTAWRILGDLDLSLHDSKCSWFTHRMLCDCEAVPREYRRRVAEQRAARGVA